MSGGRRRGHRGRARARRRRRHARAGAGQAARPSRRAQPRDGLLLLQQHRHRRRARARARPDAAWPSWTTTSITATARSGASTTIRRCCSSRRTSIRTIRAPARPATSGRGAGAGFTVNLPLSAGATDADYELVYTKVALPVLAQFRPELILISAGFDAHMDDPLAGMRLTEPVLRAAHGGDRRGGRRVLRRPRRRGDRRRLRPGRAGRVAARVDRRARGRHDRRLAADRRGAARRATVKAVPASDDHWKL